jgi:MarR family
MHEKFWMHATSLERPPWMFLSNHGYVLLAIAEDPTARVRDIAFAVGITERAAMRIVRELVVEGYVDRQRVGRRNVYRVNDDAALRHPMWSGRRVRHLLDLAWPERGDTTAPSPGPNGLACHSTAYSTLRPPASSSRPEPMTAPVN